MNFPVLNSEGKLSRRDFLVRTALGAAGAGVSGMPALGAVTGDLATNPIVVFTKAYQPLKLSFAEAAALTREVGLDGVDCPVRPGGEILPERAGEELAQYAGELKKLNLQIPLITTGITRVTSPYVQEILRTGKNVGVRYYRLGFVSHSKDVSFEKQARETKAWLKDLAALNKELGLTVLFQNHSGGTLLGGNLSEMVEIVSPFEPDEVGVAFDIGHALIVHGDGWRSYFEKLKNHIRIVYVKDTTRAGHWVRFGEGDIGGLGYFTLLKQMGYRAPICMHIEYEWAPKGQPETRAGIIPVLKDNLKVLKKWLAEA